MVVLRSVMTLLVVGIACGRPADDGRDPAAARGVPSSRLATPHPIEPFAAVDIDGRDVSSSTWKGRVVVINAWATWCAPCRREMPALVALQDKYRDRLLIVGLLQDKVTDAFAREFGASTKLNYPIVRSTFDIESRLPPVLALPATFVIDKAGRLVAAFAGEIDIDTLEREIKLELAR